MRELTLEEKVQRALDYQEVQNVMSKHMYLYGACKHQEEIDQCWAMKQPDVRWTYNGCVYEGEDFIKFYVTGWEDRIMAHQEEVAKWYPADVVMENAGMGSIRAHVQTTPIIEIAGDGKTAKGVWYSNGLCAWIDGNTGKPFSANVWEKYGVDFIKEDGQWRIWHLSHYWDFALPTGKSMADIQWPDTKDPRPQWTNDFNGNNRMKGLEFTRYTDGEIYKQYHPMRVPQLMPKLPEPYETFDPNDAY